MNSQNRLYMGENFSAVKRLSFFSWLLKLIPIPVGIISAKLMSGLISCATDGDVGTTVKTSIMIISFTAAVKLFDVISGIAFRNISARVMHRCKIEFYKRFLSSPLSVLYESNLGDTTEKLNDDFGTVTGRYISAYPEFGTGIIMFIAYFIFLARGSFSLSVMLLGISLVQLIPPIIVKRHMQINYDNCRDIEAEITDFTVSGHHGFSEIKLYGLKSWWLDKLKLYHNRYSKIGRMSIYTYTTESVLNTFLGSLLKYGTYGIIGAFVLFENITMEFGIQAIVLTGGFYGAADSVFSLIPRFSVIKKAEQRLSDWFNSVSCKLELADSSEIKLSGVSFCYGRNKDGAKETAAEDAAPEKSSYTFPFTNRRETDTGAEGAEDSDYRYTDILFDCSKLNVVKGANGAGKTTLFNLIAGLLHCRDGKITVGGVESVMLSSENFPSRVFYLPQDDAVFDFSPSELYEMAAPESRGKAFEYAACFGLSAKLLEESSIRELSGGERKKVFLSLAFAVNPLVLLMDEPTNSLDSDGREQLKNMLKERNRGALLITHDSVFDDISEHVYTVMKGGAIVEKR